MVIFAAQMKVFQRLIIGFLIFIAASFLLRSYFGNIPQELTKPIIRSNVKSPPLVMKGGDPYIRALMRTISASESNVSQPYRVIYGGQTFSDFSHHPDLCVTISWGPNRGNCSTAAGRYQFLSSTWEEMAKRYHPNYSGFWFWQSYSFEPKYQDAVVHAWLSDRRYWKADIPSLLRQGKLDRVLRLLSSTWTSLGYGIETNSMTRHLPGVYRVVLQDELLGQGSVSSQQKADSTIIEYFPKELDKGVVEKSLKTLNFQVIIMPTIVNDIPTNSIWFGSRISIEDVKLVAETLISAGVKIKAIRPFARQDVLSDLSIRVGADPQMEYRESLTLKKVQEASKFTR